MNKIISLMIVLSMTLFLAGCPKKPVVKEETEAPVKAMKTETKPEPAPEIKEESRPVSEPKVESSKEAVRSTEKTSVDRMTLLKEEFSKFGDIHFEFDRYDISDYDRANLKKLADWLSENKDIKIQVEGHCDERGSNDYNLALGDRRAISVRQYLVTLGTSKSRISAITYGEEKPLCTESTEECWRVNRRAHLLIMP